MGSLSPKKKGSTVLVLHQLRKEGLNSNAKAVRHRGGAEIRGAFSEANLSGRVVSDSEPTSCSRGTECPRNRS